MKKIDIPYWPVDETMFTDGPRASQSQIRAWDQAERALAVSRWNSSNESALEGRKPGLPESPDACGQCQILPVRAKDIDAEQALLLSGGAFAGNGLIGHGDAARHI
ncbi:MAG: hypothetical protein LBU07_07350 [Coriobacteriales bacterium]|nr:hypothetical protein [Coriobacteriales bacterium]